MYAVTPCGATFIDNLGDARSRGFDALITLNPMSGLSFDLGVGYQDTTFQDTIYAAVATNPKPIVSRKGDRLATPWIANFAADYETSQGTGPSEGRRPAADTQWARNRSQPIKLDHQVH